MRGMDERGSVVQVQGDQGRLESNVAVARSEKKGGVGYRVDTVRLVEWSLVHRGRGHGGTGAMDGLAATGRSRADGRRIEDLTEWKPALELRWWELTVELARWEEKRWSGAAWQVQPLCGRMLAARGTAKCP